VADAARRRGVTVVDLGWFELRNIVFANAAASSDRASAAFFAARTDL